MTPLPASRPGLLQAYPAPTDTDRWNDPSGPYNIECINNRHCLVILVLDLHVISISNHHQEAVTINAFCRTGNPETSQLIWNTITRSYNKHTTLYEICHLLQSLNLPLFDRIVSADWRTVQHCITKATAKFFGRLPLPAPYKRKPKVPADLPTGIWKPGSLLVPQSEPITFPDRRYRNYAPQSLPVRHLTA